MADLANRVALILAKDTGWVAITLAGGTLSGTAFYKRVGATVTVTWHIIRDTALSAFDNSLFTIPAGHRPSTNLYGAGVQHNAAVTTFKAVQFSISATTGVLTFTKITSAVGDYFSGTITYVTSLPSA